MALEQALEIELVPRGSRFGQCNGHFGRNTVEDMTHATSFAVEDSSRYQQDKEPNKDLVASADRVEAHPR